MQLSDYFLLDDAAPATLLIGQYDPWLVALSLFIAVAASFMALTMAAAARNSPSRGMARLHLATGALALGAGIWSMHFIGMLAFQLCTTVNYTPGITLVSLVPGILASWVTLNLLSNNTVNITRLLAGGLAVGLGIGSMHYIGMAAMTLAPSLRYDPLFFALSIVVATVLATLALWISFGLRQHLKMRGNRIRLLAGAVMGLAIAGMHYTAMEAARFVGQADPDFIPGSDEHYLLSFSIALVTILLGVLISGLNALVRYRNLLARSEESASELQAMFDTAVDGIIKISAAGTILSANRSVACILGYSEDELLGHNVKMLMPTGHKENHDQYLSSYLITGTAKVMGQSREVFARHKDGRNIPVRLAIGEFRRAGTVTFVGFISDISERYKMEHDLRRAKEEAEQAAQAKSVFLANMSHEIRTPMNSILGFTELLLSSPLNETQERNLTIVRNSAQSLLALLNNILDTAKFESGSDVLESRDFSLRAICQQLIATQSLAARRKGIELILDYSTDIGEHFVGDPLRVQQVLLNLLSNAVKFTEQGRVDLQVCRCRRGGDGVEINVRDTGIGIPADRLHSIFDPFSQADTSMTRRFGGTGLGTTIARQLVELMGGQLEVSSMVGEGSCFTVCLPLPPGNASNDADMRMPEVRLPPLRILAADDVPQNLQLLEAILTRRGHRLISVCNGQDAVTLYCSGHFDLVLMDVQMPVMDGHEASRRIRLWESEHQRHATPIIALTASVLEQDRRAARAAGMDGFAAKPLDITELSLEIASVLGIEADDSDSLPATSSERLLINRQHGEALWQSRRQHMSAVRAFLTDDANQPGRLEALLRQGDTMQAGALREVHRLRGISANLSLESLADVYGLLEQHLHATNNDYPYPLVESVRRLHGELAQLIQAEGLPAADTPAGPQEPAMSGAELLAVLGALVHQLQRGELPDEPLADVMRSLPDTLADAVHDAALDFECEKLAALLDDYRQTLIKENRSDE
ncbi:MHYT domain-containing protein [Thalassolituus sp. LLYu03]|uniref:MHYT domain-containing protein n=1 Tax=Thalassolituus sp. LLYu03 TaxID=3421656 RepID=UPI003D278BDD